MKRKLATLILTAVLAMNTIACSATAKTSSTTVTNTTTSQTTSQTTSNNSTAIDALDSANLFSKKDKEIEYDEKTSKTIKLNNESITISEEGTYIFSGTITNGQVIVDAPKEAKITLVLDSVSINNDTSAAIYVKQADKVFITLAKNSINTLSNKSEFIAIDDNNIDGVIFSKDDLTLNGQGKLIINANYGNGIVSKDDLIITSGDYEITAANHGLQGKDNVKISDGNITIKATKDAIHSENSDDTSLGYVYIGGGNLNLTSSSDAIDSSSIVQIDNGTINITADDDGIHSDGRLIINGGKINILQSNEGLEGEKVDITGGEINVISKDDGLNATSGSSTTNTQAQDNSQSSENTQKQSKKERPTPPQGGQMLNSSNRPKPPQDGQMPNSSNRPEPPQDGQMPPHMGGGMDEVQENAYINITGGTITIKAGGDGVDSNGNITVSGGTTYVYGPTNDGNGSLDYNGAATISSGTFITAGSSGMAQNFGNDSTQGSILLNLSSSKNEGTKVTVTNSSGKAILTFTPQTKYNSLLISSPDIKQGEQYTITAGDETQTVEMTSNIYSSNERHR
ncbi:PF14262 domain protein [Peptoanaerobacter stomatis]|uniref:PF14262 domain protein n=1 Tax=Peptoanaerobacter stomatis TaxID=796937 RepID=J6HB12_9FIRM|nr:carbohydrate-binding domain-containing protein [Peptoanaerobacter stomatis]EJU20033.1 PF14262 domain protein [Peptoanaerobacter stomatis]